MSTDSNVQILEAEHLETKIITIRAVKANDAVDLLANYGWVLKSFEKDDKDDKDRDDKEEIENQKMDLCFQRDKLRKDYEELVRQEHRYKMRSPDIEHMEIWYTLVKKDFSR